MHSLALVSRTAAPLQGCPRSDRTPLSGFVRSSRLGVLCSSAQRPQPATAAGGGTRRRFVGLLAGAPLLSAVRPAPLLADEGIIEGAVEVAPAPRPAIRGIPYRTPQFVMKLPDGWNLIDLDLEGMEPAAASPARPQMLSTNGPAAPPTPVQAKFSSVDGQEKVSVVAKGASAIKPTFFQVTDISQWGNVKEAAKFLVPSGAKILTFSENRPTPLRATTAVDLAPKKEGVRSFVNTEVLQRTYYTYDFVVGASRFYLTACALQGEIYVVAFTAPAATWDEGVAERARFTSDTFRVLS